MTLEVAGVVPAKAIRKNTNILFNIYNYFSGDGLNCFGYLFRCKMN
jgi:hypothetical protein